ncbi:chitinase [Trichoderma arundinaceum]|uniref:Chitinase n=1 Tax=Trichoderma arundinaceum TaxID=490622 RepID=A0A395NK36_TRIAR|nr:chitinase [Trichoderma arundinaceum]
MVLCTYYETPYLLSRCKDTVISKHDETLQEKLAIRFIQWGGAVTVVPSADIETAVNKLGQSLRQDTGAYEFILFAMSGSTIIATYIGSEFDKIGSMGMIQRSREHIKDLSGTTKAAVEICRITGGSTFGVIADFTGEIAFVQQVLWNWSNAVCLPSTISASF